MRFEVIRRYGKDGLIVRDTLTGHIRLWIRGFTYRAWRCAVTGEVIQGSSRSTKHWAWRILTPTSREETNMRVKAKIFDILALEL